MLKRFTVCAVFMSVASAAPSNASDADLPLNCDGVVYVNENGQRAGTYSVDIDINLNVPQRRAQVSGRGFFSETYIIVKTTPQKYYLIAQREIGQRGKDLLTGLEFSTTLDRNDGYLIMMEGPLSHGTSFAFNGNCKVIKPKF